MLILVLVTFRGETNQKEAYGDLDGGNRHEKVNMNTSCGGLFCPISMTPFISEALFLFWGKFCNVFLTSKVRGKKYFFPKSALNMV